MGAQRAWARGIYCACLWPSNLAVWQAPLSLSQLDGYVLTRPQAHKPLEVKARG